MATFSLPIALVTGAGSGIGRAAALGLMAEGFHVVLAGRRQEALEETLAQGIAQARKGSGTDSAAGGAAMPGEGSVCTVDVSQPDSVARLFETIRTQHGRLDCLFNNAGINVAATPIEDLAFDDWQRVVAVNLSGAFLCAQAAVRMMKVQNPQGGRIINNGSISAYTPRPHAVAYNATKHAISGLTKSISLEGRRYRVACGQIDIGNAATDMTAQMAQGVLQADGRTASEPQMALTHVADAVRYMARLPLEANVQFMTVMATTMPYIGRG